MAATDCEIDGLGWCVGLTYALVMLAVGARVGYLGGKTGLSYARSLVTAAGHGGLFIILISVIYATVVALSDLRETPTQSQYIKWIDANGLCGLSLDNAAWDNNGQCHCCTCLAYLGDISPTDQVYGSMCRGFLIAFVAPVYSVIGAVYAGIAAGLAFPFGTRRRARQDLEVGWQ